jgi:hypothetical protein
MFAARRLTASNTAALKRSFTGPQAQQSTAGSSSTELMTRTYSSNKIVLEEPSTIFKQAALPRSQSFDRVAMENYIHTLLF